jgi:FkbM family methyltransferase
LFEPNYKSWPSIKQTYEANKLKEPLFNFLGFASNKTQLEPTKPDTALNLKFGNTEDGWPECSKGDIEPAHGFSELVNEADGLPQIKIDDLIDRIKPPTVITFDCEGSDWEVLKGAEETLKKYKPIIYASIHPEFMFAQFGEYSGDFRNWIKDFGYEERYLDYMHECHFVYWPRGSKLND